METSVDTLVYQLEDDDTSVRWATLQKLRRIAAVETSHFPVRNTRRFLQCVRRRIVGEADPRVSIEALRLVSDVMISLGDNIDQILSSILPHLIPTLPKKRKTHEMNDGGEFETLHDEMVHVFRKYASVSNDLQAVADLLVNIGLGSAQASVREISLLVLMQMLDDRFQKRVLTIRGGSTRFAIGRSDKALIVALVQAIIPAMEDSNERVIIAAEEAIAKLELCWGTRFSSEVMQFLSSEDKQTLHVHHKPISDFLHACTAAASPQPSPPSYAESSSNVFVQPQSGESSPASRPSSSKVHPLGLPNQLCFGFLNTEIVATLTTSTSNSNADWKKRTAAVEKLYTACKEVDAQVLRGLTANERLERMDELEELFDILVRLTQDVDAHLVKRSLQITQILFRKLSPPRVLEHDTPSSDDQSDNDEPGSGRAKLQHGNDSNQKDAAFYMTKMLAPMVETSANFADDDEEMESFVYALLGQVFESGCVKINTIEQVLSTSSLRHRRSQMREEALKVWIVLLLIAEREGFLSSKYAPNEEVVQTLGRLLGDTGTHVRKLAFEVAAVLTTKCRCNIYALLESLIEDEYVAQRVDWSALRARLRQKHVPELRSNGTLRVKLTATKDNTGRSHRVTSSVEQSLDGVSELRMMVGGDEQRAFENRAQENRAPGLVTTTRHDNLSKAVVGGSLSDRSYFSQESIDADGAVSWRTTGGEDATSVDIGEKLSALKKKMVQLRQEPRAKRTQGPNTQERAAKMISKQRKTVLVSSSDHCQQIARSKSSPERMAHDPTNDVDTEVQSKESRFYQGSRDKRVHPNVVVSASPSSDIFTSSSQQPMQHSPQRLQSLQSDAVNCEDRPLKSKFIEQNEVIETAANSHLSTDDRPIRPMATSGDADQIYSNFTDQENPADMDNNEGRTVKRRNNGERVMSLATRKRLEAKAKQDSQATYGISSVAESPERKEVRKKEIPDSNKPWKKSSPSKTSSTADESDNKSRPSGIGKHEPRYLEPHEIMYLVNPKQDLSKALTQLRGDDWEANFEALNTVRRLATHHAGVADPVKLHVIVAEILKQISNLRSSVSKNALLALESVCGAYARAMDAEVDTIVPVLLRRCADSNSFVCESAAASLHSVVLNCSTNRVVAALGAHVNSKSVPIRREVARGIHALLDAQAEVVQTSKDLPAIVQLVGRCLEDSHNEVRDVAKQSIAYLCYKLHISTERLKRLLPASAQTKVDSLLSGKSGYIPSVLPGSASAPDIVSASSISEKRDGTTTARAKKVKKSPSTKLSPPSSVNGTRQGINTEELDRLGTKLNSSNWKDRFDALNEATDFICGCAPGLVESGRMIDLFDSLIKRLDDGNAKVNVLALECMERIIPAVGNGLEQVLSNLVPVITKNLSSNTRMSSLAQSVIQLLCAHIDGRALCQHFVTQARSANSRAISVLLDTLTQLTARSSDEKNQNILTRQVLPLALDLLKEAKSSVKEANGHLLRQLRRTLGTSAIMAAASKLSSTQQEKLASILR